MDKHVRLMHHDPRWRQEFEQTRSSILQSCAGWVTAVEHIGSTAVSGLIARPTIDVVASVDDPHGIDAAALLIEGLNYRRDRAPDWTPQSVFLIKPRYAIPGQPEPTHSVLLVHRSAPQRSRVLRVRDFLRSNTEAAIRFEETKVARWRSGEGDLRSYAADKAVYFAHLEDQIEAADRSS